MTPDPGRGRPRGWIALGLAVVAGALLLDLVGIPSPTIIAALVVGVVVALRRPGRFVVGRPPAAVAHAVIGAVLGVQLGGGSLSALGSLWPALLLGTAVTLVASILLGLLLERTGRLDAPTATLAMVPGGAIGVVAMARELGADDRLVAFSQYLRVFVILASIPVVAATIPSGSTPNAAGALAEGGGPAAWAAVLVLAGAGWALAALVRVPTPSLLGPLMMIGAVAVLAPGVAVAVPDAVREGAFALVGLDVGLRFTRASLAHARGALPVLSATLALLILACFAVAVVLTLTTSMELIDAYLATTPGGLSVVAATAYGTGANLPVVVAAQTVRVLVMMLFAPLAVRLVVRVRGWGRPAPTVI